MKFNEIFLFISLLLCTFSLAIAQKEIQIVLPIGHTGHVTKAVFSPDNRFIFTTGEDNTAILWEKNTGKQLVTLKLHTESITYSRYSFNGNYILLSSKDKTASIWTSAGVLLRVLKEHTEGVNFIDISPDGKYVVTASEDGSAIIWRFDIGRILFTLKGHSQSVTKAIFSPDGKYVLTSSWDKTMKLWKTEDGTCIRTYSGHSGCVNTIAFTHTGSYILSSAEDNTAKLWNTETGELLISFDGHTKKIETAVFSPDLKYVLAASRDGTAKLWESKSGKLLHTFTGHTKMLKSAHFSMDGKKIVTASYDGHCKIWSVSTYELLCDLNQYASFNGAVFSNDNKTLLTAGTDHTARVWDVLNCRLLYSMTGYSNQITAGCFSQDGKEILLGSFVGGIKKWSFNFENSDVVQAHGSYITMIKYSPDQQKFLTTSSDETARLWDRKELKCIQLFKGHDYDVNMADFSPPNTTDPSGGRYIVTASGDKTAKIWDTRNGIIIKTLDESEWDIVSAVFHPDGRTILTNAWDCKTTVWDVRTGRPLHTVEEEDCYSCENLFSPDGTYYITTFDTAKIFDSQSGRLKYSLKCDKFLNGKAKISPDGKYILITSIDNYLNVWDGKSFELLYQKKTDDASISSLAFSPTTKEDPNGGKFILTASDDAKAKIFISDNGNIFKVFSGHNDVVDYAVFSPVSRHILTLSRDNTCRIWEVSSGKELMQFIMIDTDGYLCILPSGYYMGDKSSIKKIHYVKNMKSLGLDQMDIKYNRPDLILNALGNVFGYKDTALIKSYYKAWQKRIEKLGIDTLSFTDELSIPECEIVNQNLLSYEQTTNTIELKIKAADSVIALSTFNVLVNGVPVYGKKGISLHYRQEQKLDTLIHVFLSEGYNRIEASVTNRNAIESYRTPVYVNYKPDKSITPKIYFVGLAIDHFKNKEYDLKYSVKDVRDLVENLKKKSTLPLVVDTFFNENLTKPDIIKIKRKLQSTNVDDIVIVSFSGHGLLNSAYDYFLSSYDIDFEKPENGGIPYEDVESLLDSIPARKKLMLIDACHSGEVDKEYLESVNQFAKENKVPSVVAAKGVRVSGQSFSDTKKIGLENSFKLMQDLFINVQKGSGATIISAAGGDEFAYEGGTVNNGLFTYAILKFMELNEKGSVNNLKNYVLKEVERLSNGLQKPTSRLENVEFDFYLW